MLMPDSNIVVDLQKFRFLNVFMWVLRFLHGINVSVINYADFTPLICQKKLDQSEMF